MHETRGEGASAVEVLRWPKVVHTWGRRDGRRVVVDSDYIARIGKQGEEVIRYVLEHGGAGEEELLSEFGSKTARLRDFRRRRLKPLADRGIVAVEGGYIRLTPAWREALERARDEGEEPQDNRLQAQKAERRKLERRAYFERVRRGEIPKADPAPALRGKAAVREVLDRHGERWQREEADKLRPMVEPAKAFVAATLEGLDKIRLELLEEVWRERGGQRWHLRLALRELRCRARRHPEHPGELFVYPPIAGRGEGDPPAGAVISFPERSAAVVRLREPESPKKSDTKGLPAGEWHSHPLDCECPDCSAGAPTYVRAWSGA